ncbi:hypothetical protein RIF29_30410 [Crotalaria pallida]|uniref:DUF962 domain-containing protein n=1 Tax=Crotalaria pallida TaxID=3830 RepID=A0AAN9HWN6_CROPI
MNFKSLEDFWVFYMNQHSKPSTRRWHFVGTLFSIVFLLCSFLFSWWFLFFVPFAGYGCAWYSHFFVEGNVPATFGHPFWSFLCDCRMFGLMLTGQMDREIKRLGKRPVIQVCVAAAVAVCMILKYDALQTDTGMRNIDMQIHFFEVKFVDGKMVLCG